MESTGPVSFSRDLPFDERSSLDLERARKAVREEYRGSTRWKRLTCLAVELVSQTAGQALYSLEVGRSIELDWTWEGSTAFRPLEGEDFRGRAGAGEAAWSGDVLEIDEVAGRIYVMVRLPENRPTTGAFILRPFEFLRNLHELYQETERDFHLARHLGRALGYTRGGEHPPISGGPHPAPAHVSGVLDHYWSLLWGPPGTGKTFTIGECVSTLLARADERILVVSTTNRATDLAALSIARAVRRRDPHAILRPSLIRIGKGARFPDFVEAGFPELLDQEDHLLREEVARLKDVLARTENREARLELQDQLKQCLLRLQNGARAALEGPSHRVVVTTSFNGLALAVDSGVRALVQRDQAPFTTLVVDEAGLISRAAVAALSLLAARRVLVVGDPRQLSPITRMSRVIPREQAEWIAESALNHLRVEAQAQDGVHQLTEQHRMHPDVRRAVSSYQYQGSLRDAPTVLQRPVVHGSPWDGHPRVVWYVIDEAGEDHGSIRAERGPGNRSWVRPCTRSILLHLLKNPALRATSGLFISPFVAQAREMVSLLKKEGIACWSSSTVHRLQGTESDGVIFDTVNAGSHAWSFHEWQRLINVAISRAREWVILVCSRKEMSQPYLEPLLESFAPRVMALNESRSGWLPTSARRVTPPIPPAALARPESLGNQILTRRAMRPLLSAEQARLCNFKMDGRPRLVRGVAGSGKTYVLAYWLTKVLIQEKQLGREPRMLIVYGNNTLRTLLEDNLARAWQDHAPGFGLPRDQLSIEHVREVLHQLFRRAGYKYTSSWDFDGLSKAFIEAGHLVVVEPVFDALFIDEAQDFGPNTLQVLFRLVRQSDPADENSRAIFMFYDNAQNLYQRPIPSWAKLGVDVRGRSTVMKESFRSTRPISEYALNVLCRLDPDLVQSVDHKELCERHLVEKVRRGSQDWWNVRFNQIEGPPPTLRRFRSRSSQIEALRDDVVRLLVEEGVEPHDIAVLFPNRPLGQKLKDAIEPALAPLGHQILHEKPSSMEDVRGRVQLSTVHSFKGFDAEIVLIAGVDEFHSKEMGILAHTIYVALTRARSILHLYGHNYDSRKPGGKILDTLESVLDTLVERESAPVETSAYDDAEDLIHHLGEEHRAAIEGLSRLFRLDRDPLVEPNGEILAEPAFSWTDEGTRWACFREAPSQRKAQHLEDSLVRFLTTGQLSGYLGARQSARESTARGAPGSRGFPAAQAGSGSSSGLSPEQARVALERFRDEVLHVEHSPESMEMSLLRKEVLDILLERRPRSRTEFTERVPLELRRRTHPRHLSKGLDRVLEIVRRVKPDK